MTESKIKSFVAKGLMKNDWGSLTVSERVELVLRIWSRSVIPEDWTPEACRIARRGKVIYDRLKYRNSFEEAARRARVAMIDAVLVGPGDGKARRSR